jgi:hypothetical protein
MDYHVINTTGRPLTNRIPRFTTEIPPLGSVVGTYVYPESDWVFSQGEAGAFVASYYAGEMLGHSDQARDRTLVTWPHFTTSITLKGGASGGPVFDERGRVFGIHSVGGFEGISYMARACELLSLTVPEFPGTSDQCEVTVLDLAKAGQIVFDPVPE